MHVLLVEDDARLAATLRSGMERVGITASTAGAAEPALRVLDSGPVDVVVLDVMLPGLMDGIDMCRELRRRRLPVPVLMLTALDDVPERVRGLEAGADDYLVKPFAFDELVARLRALTRRGLSPRGGVLGEGRVRLDTGAMELVVDEHRVPLTPREHGLLELLMLNPDQVLGRGTLEDRVWAGALAPESNLVDVYVARLRRKLRDAGGPDVIETVRGAGYRLRREMAQSSESSDTPASG